MPKDIYTLHEIAHYVRCIPFQQEDNFKIWSSPDFMMTMKKGTSADHCLLMASMMRSTMFEDWKDFTNFVESDDRQTFKDEMTKYPMADRVFVCLGTLKKQNNSQPHAWVMTINRSFDEVTFWESRKSIKYPLKGRIQQKEIPHIQAYFKSTS